MKTIYSTFFKQAKETPNNVYIYDFIENKELTFQKVLDNSLRIASLLKNSGVNSGMRVAVMIENSSEFIYIYLALMRLNAIIVPINTKFKSLALRQILSDSESKCLIFSTKYEDDIITATEILENIDIFISLENNSSFTNNYLCKFKDYPLFGGPYNKKNDSESVIFYSEGSTGPTKGVIYNQQSLINNANVFQTAMLFKTQNKIYAQFPFSHYFSITAILNNSLIAGIPIIISNDIKDIEDNDDIVIIATPSFYESIANTDALQNIDSIKLAITGGGKLKPEITEYFLKNYKLPIYKNYGMIEVGPIVSTNTNKKKAKSIGTPLKDISIAIMDNEKFLQPNIIGEICIRNTNIVKKYCSKNIKIENCILLGWYQTGDIGYQDIDGYFYFIDRKINIINVNGFDVYPEIVEHELLKHDLISEVAVTGYKEKRMTEKLVANIVTVDKRVINQEELKLFLKNKILKYQIPDKFTFLNHLPKNATGKISRQSLRRKNTTNIGGK
ncbi:MAG: AMP-binding protein [Candidatus Marinimicrobia bacterium]|nr:AMP-binding protein [Candidatus Neomarinimicrobiota bacterium]